MTVRDLDACETYVFNVIVAGPLGYGPPNELKTVKTGVDFKAPPKNVIIQRSTDNVTDAEIVWSPPCDPGDAVLDYWITIHDISLDAVTNLSLSSNKNRIHLRQSFYWGALYNISIQLDDPDVRIFGPISVSGPKIPAPEQLAVERCDAGVLLQWSDPDLHSELVAHGYSYRVRLSRSLLVIFASSRFLFYSSFI